jgi:ATP-dependent DNA helicase RecG
MTATASLPPGGLTLESPVGELPRVSPARARALREAGLETVEDLLRHYPRRHEDRRKFPRFPASAPTEGSLCLRGSVRETKMSRFGRRCLFTLTLAEGGGEAGAATVKCRWFNLRYMGRILQAGQDIVIHGRPKALKAGGVVFDHPDFEVLEKDASDSDLIHLNRLAPIHPSVGPWSPRMMRRLIFETLQLLGDGAVSTEASTARTTPPLRAIHFPASEDELEIARAQLAREELLEMQLVLARQRLRQTSGAAAPIPRGTLLARFVRGLSFELTAAQKRVLGSIFDDLASGRPMNRLLHGDVGSGKTIVAAAAMLGTWAAGRSAALMAPTQVLAGQHYENFRRLFEPLGVPVFLRTAARKQTPAAGPCVVIGTHALLFGKGVPEDTALVVIDEQHKFGVRQRARLAENPARRHVLVMSATPIPRTLALTLYGDLDISVLDEMPPGRTPVRTLVRSHDKTAEAAAFVRTQLDAGRQAFLVYPVINEGKRSGLKAATVEFTEWSQSLAPHRCALLHGQLDPDEKDAIMASFRAGETRVLVSTTVIEVGVDVANATVLLVENAEVFGLAQLHQLRGRVGRGTDKSWCILLTGSEASDKLDRLKVLEEASDGFTIAEADLTQRGPGDMLGTDQTGLPPVRLAQLPRDLALLEEAREEARRLVATDPELSAHPQWRRRVARWERALFAGVA